MDPFEFHSHLTWAEVDLKAIRHNYQEIKRIASRQIEVLPVIKADAYGHGMIPVATLLNRRGVRFLGVSNVNEGKALRKHGINKTILLFESTLPDLAEDIVDYDLTPTICTLSLAAALNRYAKFKNKRIGVHIKVDTGMGRLGVWHREAREFIKKVLQYSHLSLQGLYTHFPVADTDREFTKNQLKQLARLLYGLRKISVIIPFIHAANSMGLIGYGNHILNLARPGLMLYGLYPRSNLQNKVKLRPALSIKSKIIFLKEFSKGQGVSYGRTFIAKKKMKVATLPIGYSDGYLRCLSNKSHVLINGQRCPVVGRVTMDQTMVDVTQIKSTWLGQEVVILGSQKNQTISADDLAKKASTISYEIVCSLGNSLPRVYKG